MSHEVVEFIKDWLWAPLLGLVAWAWTHNEKQHESLRAASEAAMEAARKARDDASVSHSVLMDKIMVHMDDQFKEHTAVMRLEDGKLSEELAIHRQHIAKLFEKLEESRKDTAIQLTNHAERSEDRHREVMHSLQALTQSFHVALNQKADK